MGVVNESSGSTTTSPNTYGATPGVTASGSTSGFLNSLTAGKLTSGWYVFIAITGGVMLGGTPLAPVVFGVLSLALIYQTSLLLEGK